MYYLSDQKFQLKPFEILEFGASKARKIAAAKMEVIRDAVGLI